MIRKSTKLKIIIAVSAVAVLTAAAGVTYALVGETMMNDSNSTQQSTIVSTQNRPVIYATEDGFTRYLQSVQNGTSIIDKEHVHQAPTVDWNEQAIASVPFSILSSQSYRSISIETVDGKKTIIVDILDSPKGCFVTQDNKEHVAFIAINQSETAADFAVSTRIFVNDAGCNN